MILERLDEAQESGARMAPACEVVGLDPRTVQRWRVQKDGDDQRDGPRREPANKLSPAERRTVLDVANSPEFRDLSPHQIVPSLADQGTYVGSESTVYRILRQAKLLAHRERSRPKAHHRPDEHLADGPNPTTSHAGVLGRSLYPARSTSAAVLSE